MTPTTIGWCRLDSCAMRAHDEIATCLGSSLKPLRALAKPAQNSAKSGPIFAAEGRQRCVHFALSCTVVPTHQTQCARLPGCTWWSPALGPGREIRLREVASGGSCLIKVQEHPDWVKSGSRRAAGHACAVAGLASTVGEPVQGAGLRRSHCNAFQPSAPRTHVWPRASAVALSGGAQLADGGAMMRWCYETGGLVSLTRKSDPEAAI